MKAESCQYPAHGESWDAIVVGSGIGGLPAAALLSSFAGKRVLVLERHSVVGGYTHVFRRQGYEWDVGLHYVGEVQDENGIVRRIFDRITDGCLQWAPMPEVYDQIIIGNQSYNFVSGIDNFRAHLKGYFPEDSAAIDKYCAAVQAAQKASSVYYAEKAVPRPVAFIAGSIMRRGFLRWTDYTTAEVLDSMTPNRQLKRVLTAQWGNYGLPPEQSSFGIHAMIASHYFEGASFPVGGSGRIAETVTPVIERGGGKIVVNAEVIEVLLDKNKAVGVRLRDGREFRAPLVISDAGARNTFERLLPRSSRLADRFRGELQNIPSSIGHLCLYVGVKKSSAELGIKGTNLWVHPEFEHNANLERFATDFSSPFPWLYISFPSAKDPDFERRHPGRATIEVLTPAPYGPFEKWQNMPWKHRGQDYDALKQQFSRRLQDELVRHVPALAGNIDYVELSTPLSTRHIMNHQAGEMFGLSVTPERFRLRSLRPRTPVRNLYLTGQDIAGPGITGALFGGVISASAILGRNLLSAIGSGK